MNSKQNRKWKRLILRKLKHVANLLDDLATDLGSGRLTQEQMIDEIRSLKKGMKGL